MENFENTELYRDRYCAFVDILGFREIISKLDRGQTPVLDLVELLRAVHHPTDNAGTEGDETEFRVQSISDAVAISAAPTRDGVLNVLLAINLLASRLLAQGFFIRGGVARGRLYHDKEMIFGEALVGAYHFESKVARYARVVVSRQVKHDIDEYLQVAPHHASNLGDIIRQAKDGPYYVNLLRNLAWGASQILPPGTALGMTALGHDLFEMRTRIQQRLEEAVDNPGHYEKVLWFADYWNRVMPRSDDLPKIDGPGLEDVLVAG